MLEFFSFFFFSSVLHEVLSVFTTCTDAAGFKIYEKTKVDEVYVCFTSDEYALLFPRKGTSDYVMTRGMPSLTAVTVCLWIKTADTGNVGTPLSYALSTQLDNEIILDDYRNLRFYVGGTGR